MGRKVYINEEQSLYLIEKEPFKSARLGLEKEGYVIAQHAVGSTDDSEIWKDYWEKNHYSHHFPSEPHICPSCQLPKEEFVGSHIVSQDEIFIAPICKECNDIYKNGKAEDHFFYIKQEDIVRAPKD